MFILRYVKYSFNFSKVFTRVSEKSYKVIIYFLLLSLIQLFPMNYLIINEQGWRLDFIEEGFLVETPDWQLPENCRITLNTLMCTGSESYLYEHQGITYIFNDQEESFDASIKQVIFRENEIIYTNGEGAHMIGRGYRGFVDELNFQSLNLTSGEERQVAYLSFARQIENSFSPFIIFYTLLTNTVVSIGLNVLFIILLSLVLQLFRFGYSKFFTYKESLKFLVFMMGLPAMLSFIVGLIQPAFSPVFFQLGMGIATMAVMLIYGKKYFA